MRKVLIATTLVLGLLAAAMPRVDAQSSIGRFTRVLLNGQCVLRSGSGSPEGAVTGNVCDAYLRTDGADGTTLYVKASGTGNTGWTPAATSTSSGSAAASYITKVAESGLSNEFALGTLATALLVNTTTTGVPTAYAGTSCTNQFVRALSAVGVATCNTVTATDVDSSITTNAGTNTLTNKTLDAEGIGNVLTTVDKDFVRAARCDNATASSPEWSFPTSNPAVPACVTGTNTQRGVLDFADGASVLSAQLQRLLPGDWTGNVDVKLVWHTPATTGSVVWQVATACVADAETGDPVFNTASTVTDAAKGTANQFNDASITSLTMTGCAAGESWFVRVFRDPANGSDTLADTARLVAVELTTRRAQ